MEDRSLDKNAIIGFALIFAIMLGWLYLNQPSPEELEAQRLEAAQQEAQESLNNSENQNSVSPEAAVPLARPLDNSAYALQAGPFGFTQAVDTLVQIKTDPFTATFASRGAQLVGLTLND